MTNMVNKIVILSIFICSCGSVRRECEPGAHAECSCSNGFKGEKICLDDGSGWRECSCNCVRNCTSSVCGDDGCGGSCGFCDQNEECIDDQCECLYESCLNECCDEGELCYYELCCKPGCEEKECGADECGGICPPGCSLGFFCNQESGQCEACVTDCESRDCGPDMCGGECPPGCDLGETCNDNGKCVGAVERIWVTVYAGTFRMGSPLDEPGRYSREYQHEVTITRDFIILSTEVTQVDFDEVMSYNPSEFHDCGPDCPVEDVTWGEAAAFCNALSLSEGYDLCYDCTGSGANTFCELGASHLTPYDCQGYRLPTEAEWEYSARAGTTTSTYSGNIDENHLLCEWPNLVLDSIAWYCGNGQWTLHPVKQMVPNEWGLYDMLGNLWEWCHDLYAEYPEDPITDPWGSISGEYRVIRGGAFIENARDTRAASRRGELSSIAGSTNGFRVVRSLQ